MATHVVKLQVSRFCKVYVDDPADSMTGEEILQKAKDQFLNGDDPDSYLDDEMNDIEPEDITSAFVDYDLYD